MSQVSYSDIFGISFEHEGEEPVEAGDLVRTGDSARPQFSVLAVAGDKAWLRNVDTGADGIVERNRCRKIVEPA